MDKTDVHINFDAPATLRKWPSINNERVSAADGGRPYLIVDGTLDDCIRQFMAKPVSQHHLYEIHTTPQQPLVSLVLSVEQSLNSPGCENFYRVKNARGFENGDGTSCQSLTTASSAAPPRKVIQDAEATKTSNQRTLFYQCSDLRRSVVNFDFQHWVTRKQFFCCLLGSPLF